MKPVIRYRSGRWICRGGGHSGSSRSPVAAYCAWAQARMHSATRLAGWIAMTGRY